jgi:hypothetical protein
MFKKFKKGYAGFSHSRQNFRTLILSLMFEKGIFNLNTLIFKKQGFLSMKGSYSSSDWVWRRVPRHGGVWRGFQRLKEVWDPRLYCICGGTVGILLVNAFLCVIHVHVLVREIVIMINFILLNSGII